MTAIHEPATENSDDVKDGHSLRLASHDSRERSSRSNVISSAQYGGAINPGVAVRGVGCVQRRSQQ